MVWLISLAAVAAALVVWLVPVPRIHIPADDPDDPPPHFPSLPTPTRTVTLAVATLVAAQVLHVLPPELWLLWAAYIAVGAPLVLVDALTTWLPRRLHMVLVASMLPGLAWLGVAEPRAAVGALLGALAGFVVLFVAWRVGSGMGFGDVRLAAPMGAAAGAGGLQPWFTALLAATVIGAVWAILHALRRRTDKQLPGHFPYGPALWLGPLAGALFSAA